MPVAGVAGGAQENKARGKLTTSSAGEQNLAEGLVQVGNVDATVWPREERPGGEVTIHPDEGKKKKKKTNVETRVMATIK